jgi:hypothetical protein
MTKYIFNLICLFVSLSSWAGGIGGNAGGTGGFRREFAVDRTELLRLNRYYDVKVSELPLQGVNVGVTNLCVGFNNIHTITPVRIETASSSEEKSLSTPRFREVKVCTSSEGKTCLNYKTNLEMIQTQFSMDVVDVPRGDNSFGRYMYKVNYVLPPCANITSP